MNLVRTLTSALPLALALFVGGCSAETVSEEAGSSEDAVSTSTTEPITLANYVNHPTIKVIRAEVARIDALKLTVSERPDCHSLMRKWEAGGKARKVQIWAGEGGFDNQETAYFRENGKLLFIHGTYIDYEKSEKGVTTERRIYLDEAGKILFQTFRDPAGKDSIPAGDEAFTVGADFDSADEWYGIKFCGSGEDTENGANAK